MYKKVHRHSLIYLVHQKESSLIDYSEFVFYLLTLIHLNGYMYIEHNELLLDRSKKKKVKKKKKLPDYSVLDYFLY